MRRSFIDKTSVYQEPKSSRFERAIFFQLQTHVVNKLTRSRSMLVEVELGCGDESCQVGKGSRTDL